MKVTTQAADGLSTSLIVECPILTRETADRLAQELATDDGWTVWSTSPPLAPRYERWIIVGRDCLGYVHNATHLVGKRDGTPFDGWKRVTI